MAHLSNLLPGDTVDWHLEHQIVPAKVIAKRVMVLIEYEVRGLPQRRWVPYKDLRVVWSGTREASYVRKKQDLALAEKVGEQRLRELQ